MAKTINTRMSQKHDTEAHWNLATNFIPLAGEIIVYDEDENNPVPRLKVGNGIDNVNNLPFIGEEIVEGWGAMEVGDTTSYGIRWLGMEDTSIEEGMNYGDSIDIIKYIDNNGQEGTLSLDCFNDFDTKCYRFYFTIAMYQDDYLYEFPLYSEWVQTFDYENSLNRFPWFDPPEDMGVSSMTITSIADWAKPYLEIWKEIPAEDHYVSYKPQNLTEDQKAQVRENIGVNDIKIDQAVVAGTGESSVKIDGSYEGVTNAANGAGSVAMGGGAVSKSDGAHTEGILTTAGRITQADTADTTKVISTIGPAATEIGMPFSNQAEIQTAALRLGGFGAHAEGTNTQALGSGAHAEGSNSLAFANGAHAEGDATVAKGQVAHAEGWNTQAIGNQSHAEGSSTIAKGKEGHAEGKGTKAIGQGSHAEGNYTEATGRTAHAEGEYTEANAKYSHSEGWHTVTDEQCGHVQGKYNKSKSGYAHVVGNGNENTPSDAHTLDWQGNAWFAGDVTLGIDNKLVATEEYVNNAIANLDIGGGSVEAITLDEIDAICGSTIAYGGTF